MVNRYDVKLANAYLAAGCAGDEVDLPLPAPWLQIGSCGSQVEALESTLRRARFPITSNGIFGRASELALQKFHARQRLESDGVGPFSSRALGL